MFRVLLDLSPKVDDSFDILNSALNSREKVAIAYSESMELPTLLECRETRPPRARRSSYVLVREILEAMRYANKDL
jgi:hypothetical protein